MADVSFVGDDRSHNNVLSEECLTAEYNTNQANANQANGDSSDDFFEVVSHVG